MSESEVLSSTAYSILGQTFGYDGTVSSEGSRRMRRAVYSNSSDETEWTVDVHIPVYLESVAALRFMGLKKEAAQTILSDYNAIKAGPFPNAVSNIFSLARDRIKRNPANASGGSEDWHGALRAMGIRKRTRFGIANPAFDDIRFTKSAKEWAVETIEDKWMFLCKLDKKIKNNRAAIQRAHQPGGAARQARRRGVSSDGSSAVSITQAAVGTAMLSAPVASPGTIMLLKGGTKDRMAAIIEEFNQPGAEVRHCLSTPPTDFSSRVALVYLTKTWACAHRYAQYAASRSSDQTNEVAIVSFPVPQELLHDAYQILGDNWKKLVWGSRSGRGTYADNQAIRQAVANHAVLVGPIADGSNEQIARLSDWTQIHAMRLSDGSKPSQYVFQSEERINELKQRCAGALEYHRVFV